MFVFNFKMHKLRCSGKEKTTYVFKVKNVLDFFQSLILYKKIGCSGHVSTLWTTRCMPYDNMMYIIYYFRFDIEYSSGAQQPQRFSRRVALLCAATHNTLDGYWRCYVQSYSSHAHSHCCSFCPGRFYRCFIIIVVFIIIIIIILIVCLRVLKNIVPHLVYVTFVRDVRLNSI